MSAVRRARAFCGATSGANICQRAAHGDDTQHEDTGTYWGTGVTPNRPTLVFFCTGCQEVFEGRSIADEPVCACSCIYEDSGGHGNRRLVNGPNGITEVPPGKPHWVVFEASYELGGGGITALLKRVGYTYPRMVE